MNLILHAAGVLCLRLFQTFWLLKFSKQLVLIFFMQLSNKVLYDFQYRLSHNLVIMTCILVSKTFGGMQRDISSNYLWHIKIAMVCRMVLTYFIIYVLIIATLACTSFIKQYLSQIEWHISWYLNFLADNRKNDWFPARKKTQQK